MPARATVVHCMKEDYDVYIGRGSQRLGLPHSKWANPFIVGRDGDRDTCCEKYEEWFRHQQHLIDAIPELIGKRLGCWCKPQRCHGDFLASLANTLKDHRKECLEPLGLFKEELRDGGFCPKCGQAWVGHNDDGSCVED